MSTEWNVKKLLPFHVNFFQGSPLAKWCLTEKRWSLRWRGNEQTPNSVFPISKCLSEGGEVPLSKMWFLLRVQEVQHSSASTTTDFASRHTEVHLNLPKLTAKFEPFCERKVVLAKTSPYVAFPKFPQCFTLVTVLPFWKAFPYPYPHSR